MQNTSLQAAVPFMLLLTLGLSACGSGTPAPGGQLPLKTTGGATVETAALSSAPLGQVALGAFSKSTNAQLELTITQAVSRADFGYGKISPLSVNTARNTGLSVNAGQRVQDSISLADLPSVQLQAGASCTFSKADLTDGDKDLIPLHFLQTYDCKLGIGPDGLSYGMEYKGTWSLSDKDDANPKSGFKHDIDFTGLVKGTVAGLGREASYDVKDLLDVDPSSSGGIRAMHVYNFGVKGVSTSGGNTETLDARWLMTNDLETTPDADQKGAAIKFSGKASTTGINGSAAGALTLSGEVHYSKACSGIDSGKVVYTSGDSAVTYTYTACKVSSTK